MCNFKDLVTAVWCYDPVKFIAVRYCYPVLTIDTMTDEQQKQLVKFHIDECISFINYAIECGFESKGKRGLNAKTIKMLNDYMIKHGIVELATK